MGFYKLIITFDEMEGHAGASQKFFNQTMTPLFNNRENMYLGEVWWTLWGDRPQFLGGIIVESLAALRDLLGSQQWEKALFEFRTRVLNLEIKLVREVA